MFLMISLYVLNDMFVCSSYDIISSPYYIILHFLVLFLRE